MKKVSTRIHTSRNPKTGQINQKKVQIKPPSTRDSVEDQATTERESIVPMKPQFKENSEAKPQAGKKKQVRQQIKPQKVQTTAPISVLSMAHQLMMHDNLNIAHGSITDSLLREHANSLERSKQAQHEQEKRDLKAILDKPDLEVSQEAQVGCITPNTHNQTQPVSPPSQHSNIEMNNNNAVANHLNKLK